MEKLLTVVLTFFVLYWLSRGVHSMLDAGQWWIVPMVTGACFYWAWQKDTPGQRADFLSKLMFWRT